MPSICEVAVALRANTIDRWEQDYPDVMALLRTASVQYCTDAGCVFIWRKFPDWLNEIDLHEALYRLDDRNFSLLVVSNDCPEDSYSAGTWDYFKLRVKATIQYEGEDVWLR